ncbi:MAG TPA: ATP-binding cassette domain-containing protein [Spirochaetota bacterium]|nr:ATP-binding cassette domain-containing protein [Spirochaetota bacterium]
MGTVDLQFIDVSFRYDSSSEIIFESLNLHFAGGWTGIVGANGSGKTTVSKLATGILIPTTGCIARGSGVSAVYCAQETDVPPPDAEDFLYDGDSRAGELRSILGIGNDWILRWNTLSHGERKRFQIGVALSGDPDILALDEPANHLDGAAKRMLCEALRTYGGTGLIVSHDRDLLDEVCSRCLFMRPGSAVIRVGNFSEGEAAEERDDAARLKAYNDIADQFRKAERSARLLKHRESLMRNSLSKRNIAKHDHDAKTKIDRARLTGKDTRGARKVTLMENRAARLGARAREVYFEKRETAGIVFTGERFRRDAILNMTSREILMGGGRTLSIPDIVIRPESRIGVTGDNGAGKSVLVSMIASSIGVPSERMIYIPQEIGSRMWVDVMTRISSLGDDMYGALLTAVHRLGSEPERIRAAENPSPGEKRKMMLGLGLLHRPGLIIMDEPTNHMDIPSIRCLEEALAIYEGALMVVSHDRRFLSGITTEEWEITREGERSVLLVRF